VTTVKEIIELYKQMSADFEDLLYQRTMGEITYDNLVLEKLRKGKPIKKALENAAKSIRMKH